jgi:hypothetical protein
MALSASEEKKIAIAGRKNSNILVSSAQLRGFISLVLPNMWTLNGVPIMYEERKKWAQFYLGTDQTSKGRWSDLVQSIVSNWLFFKKFAA